MRQDVIAAGVIARYHTIRDQEGAGASMISDDPVKG